MVSPNKERGQSLVELAVSLMILLMLLTGAVEFGLALFQYVAIRDAAQEGAVYGSINPTDADGIRWRARSTANDVVTLADGDVDVAINGAPCEGSTGGASNSIEVTVRFDHPITYPFVETMIGTGVITLHASAANTILSPSCTAP